MNRETFHDRNMRRMEDEEIKAECCDTAAAKIYRKADAEALGILCAAAAGNCINNYF